MPQGHAPLRSVWLDMPEHSMGTLLHGADAGTSAADGAEPSPGCSQRWPSASVAPSMVVQEDMLPVSPTSLSCCSCTVGCESIYEDKKDKHQIGRRGKGTKQNHSD